MVFMICLCLLVVGVVVKRVSFGKEEWCVVVAAFVVSFFRRFPRVPSGVAARDVGSVVVGSVGR